MYQKAPGTHLQGSSVLESLGHDGRLRALCAEVILSMGRSGDQHGHREQGGREAQGEREGAGSLGLSARPSREPGPHSRGYRERVAHGEGKGEVRRLQFAGEGEPF